MAKSGRPQGAKPSKYEIQERRRQNAEQGGRTQVRQMCQGMTRNPAEVFKDEVDDLLDMDEILSTLDEGQGD
jgi:hypothetical protein